MDVVLVFGDSGICNRSDMENLSRKRFSNFESLDRHLASIKKGDGKSYLKSETFMGYAKIG